MEEKINASPIKISEKCLDYPFKKLTYRIKVKQNP